MGRVSKVVQGVVKVMGNRVMEVEWAWAYGHKKGVVGEAGCGWVCGDEGDGVMGERGLWCVQCDVSLVLKLFSFLSLFLPLHLCTCCLPHLHVYLSFYLSL